MRVMLINPPYDNMLSTNVPGFVDKHTGSYPPLGLLYIVSSLKRGYDCEIKFLDANVEGLTQLDMEEVVRTFSPDIVGIQMMTFTAVDSYQTAQTVKRVNQNIFVVVGGPHPNIFIDETLSKPEIDCIVLGEGERSFVELVRSISEGRGLSHLPHIAYRDKDGLVVKGTPGMIKDLDELPFPAREVLNPDKYYTIIGLAKRMTTIITSRGCPYKCLFCDRAYWGKKFRARGHINVVDEIEECVKMGIEEFDFQDDTFTLDRARVIAICDEILKRRLKIYWNIRARINTVDKELLGKLSKAGVIRIHYGVEAGTPEIINVLRKAIDLEEALRVFKLTKSYGIQTLAYFIIGSPSETEQHVIKTIKYINKLNPDYLHIGILTPFPSTDLYTMGLESGVLPNDYWKEFAEVLNPEFVPLFWEEHLSRDKLISLLRLAYRSFYFRPAYMFTQLMSVHDPLDFYRKIRAGLAVLKYCIVKS